jgi:anaerobic ribonucleoside-triphosphate reductase activating protein
MWVYNLIVKIKEIYPEIKVYIWSGYYYEELLKSSNDFVLGCLRAADVLIDGPYVQAERDITLPMRGSRNQRIINLTLK